MHLPIFDTKWGHWEGEGMDWGNTKYLFGQFQFKTPFSVWNMRIHASSRQSTIRTIVDHWSGISPFGTVQGGSGASFPRGLGNIHIHPKGKSIRIIIQSQNIHKLKEAILIYKRGCSRDGLAYEFQIGILESTCRHSPAKLRTIHPRIFLSNPFFMHENALKIAYIRQ